MVINPVYTAGILIKFTRFRRGSACASPAQESMTVHVLRTLTLLADALSEIQLHLQLNNE